MRNTRPTRRELQRERPMTTRAPRPRKASFIIVLLSLVALVFVAVAGFFAYKYFSDRPAESTTNQPLDSEAAGTVLDQVSRIYTIPTRDNVTVVRIGNPAELSGNAELAVAQKGDYYIQFSFQNHALLYRPSENKIVLIQQINSVIAIYMRDVDESQAREIAQQLQDSSTVVDVQVYAAERREVSGTVVVVNDPKFEAVAASVATQLGGVVGSLPEGETTNPSASLQIYLSR